MPATIEDVTLDALDLGGAVLSLSHFSEGGELTFANRKMRNNFPIIGPASAG